MTIKKPDYVFLGLLGAILAFGLVMLVSATGPSAWSRFQDAYWYVKHQLLVGLLPGAVLFFFFYKIDYRVWRRQPLAMLGVSLVLLLLVFIPGLAADWGTSKSWIHIGGYSLQPVEIAKLTFLFFLAAALERRAERKDEIPGGLATLAVAFVLMATLIMLQPDLGNLVVIGGIALIVYFISGAAWSHIAALLAAGAVGLFVMVKAAPYRLNRFMIFLNPDQDPKGVGYHINQAFLAIGSGGWFGLGLGHSRQKYLYLPEVAGDSIFAVAAEELGFIMTLGLLALFAFFIWRGMKIALGAPDVFGRLLATGIIAWIFMQFVFNIGSMVGLLPITGLTLPFVSYGGTSMMVLLGAMGIMANISKNSGR